MGKDKSMLKYQYGLQSQMNQQQNAWQAEQNQVDRSWQEQFWKQQFQNQSEWQKYMWELQNKYDSPEHQVELLLAAGINPALYFAGQSGAGFGGNVSSSPSPSGGSPHSVSALPSSVSYSPSNTASVFSSIAQLNDSVAQLVKAGVDTHKTESLLKPTIDNTIADTKQKQEEAALTALQRSISAVYGHDTAAANLNKLMQDAYEAATRGNMNTANGLLSEMQAIVSRQQGEYNQDAMPQMLTNLKAYESYLKSAAQSNMASAAQSSSQASLNEIYTKLQRNELQISDKSVQARIEQLLSEAEASSELPEKLREEIRTLQRQNKWEDFTKLMEVIGNVVHIGLTGVAPLGGFSKGPVSIKGFGK